MLWLAIHFPALSLEIFPSSSGPIAVAEKGIVSCNEKASILGIRPGMTISAAHALSSGLIVKFRDRNAESETLAGLAAWAGRFTPSVSIQASGLLLEIGSCIRLHGGLTNLLSMARRDLHEMGYGFILSCAPAPHSAWLLAISGNETFVMEKEEIEKAIGKLPVELLSQPSKIVEGLEMIGAKRLEDCIKLPRSALARRFGKSLIDEIDRALGKIPDPRKYFIPASIFERRLPLPASVMEAESLLFALKRVLPELSGHLALLQSGVQEIELHCIHEDEKDTLLKAGFSAPTRSHEKMLLLFREILHGASLPSPVREIRIRADKILPLASGNIDLFDDEDNEESLLIERLRIRLGKDAVFGLSEIQDHRPEKAWQTCDSGCDAKGKPGRPFWLLKKPFRCRKGNLALLKGPERIESGWWDGKDVSRDYYVARDENGSRFWVFCDRSDGEWYVQGIFS